MVDTEAARADYPWSPTALSWCFWSRAWDAGQYVIFSEHVGMKLCVPHLAGLVGTWKKCVNSWSRCWRGVVEVVVAEPPPWILASRALSEIPMLRREVDVRHVLAGNRGALFDGEVAQRNRVANQ